MKLFSAYFGSRTDPFDLIKDVMATNNPKDLTADGVLLLHGGADISPSIYNQTANNYCYADDKPNHRDQIEMDLVNQAKHLNIPIIGICRGAQLLCAMDGGHLIQHIDNHVGQGHKILDTKTRETYLANSCHHQMMVPNKYNEILAVDQNSTTGKDKDNKDIWIDTVPEIVYFPKMNAIGIQGHPEWMPNSAFTKYCAELIKKYLFKE